jgi:hypothetical protein
VELVVAGKLGGTRTRLNMFLFFFFRSCGDVDPCFRQRYSVLMSMGRLSMLASDASKHVACISLCKPVSE